MMKLDVFGIVLDAIPILISGAELCREGYSTGRLAFRKRRYVDKLASALLFQRQIVLETVRSIINQSGSTYDEKMVSGNPLAYFQDANIQTQVEGFLGDENYTALLLRLRDMQSILEEVARHLDGLIPSHTDDPSNLIGIIEANRTARRYQADFLPRLRVALKSDAIKQSISELDTATLTLSAFSTTVLMNRRGPVSSLPTPSHNKLAEAFQQIHKVSKSLYTALCRCCSGSCHHEHEMHVFLEDRVEVASKLLLTTHSLSDEDRAILAFQLIFAAKILAPIQMRCYELSIECMQEDGSDASLRELEPKLPPLRISQRGCAKSKESSSVQSIFVPIDNFCSAIVMALDKAQHVAFVLHSSNRMGLITSQEKTITLKSDYQTISLGEVLTGTSGAYGARLPLQSAMLLASKLASSLLQYAQTRWFGQAWSKHSIYFLLNSENERKHSLADFNRPFVCAKIEDTNENGVNTAQPKSILLELGILLLEIWHHTTLEHHFADRTEKVASDPYKRLSLAAEWLDDGYNTPLPLYEQAVRYCVYGASTKRWTEWNTSELWGEICKEVIKPLSDNCGQWKKSTLRR